MTPETKKALEEMQQLEKDEEIARKIQVRVCFNLPN
jgi:chaperonin cofactor prefoldin